ncbi:MAG: response regulator transcription factor [Acidobacteria bacterium]|nr:response regulator transcription factor [Acidobacteriota bacterium]
MKVLVIDDDAELCDLLKEFLTRESFEVDAAHDGEAGLKRALETGPDIVVLDVMLPKADGFTVLRRLREKSRVPVLMLTARGEDMDRILGLELGADDYLAKPFNPRELAARLRAILRRVQAPPDTQSPVLEVNAVRLLPASREVFAEGRPVELTTFEFDILQVLMRAAGRVLSRDALMEELYQRKASPFDRSIDVHVSHLRRKLETGRTVIKTVRGVGYQFCRSGEEAAEP